MTFIAATGLCPHKPDLLEKKCSYYLPPKKIFPHFPKTPIRIPQVMAHTLKMVAQSPQMAAQYPQMMAQPPKMVAQAP